MKVIGITGGVGSGKSTVLKLIKDNFNAYTIMADNVAHMLMEPKQPAYNSIVEVFGESILNEDSTINRPKLSGIVFNNKYKLMVLNSIVHPLVKKYITEDIAYKRCEGEYDYYFIEAALLIEDHYDAICDELWYIHVNEDIRCARLMSSRGYTKEKVESIFNNQLDEAAFREHCQVVISNEGDLQDTLRQLKKELR